MAVREDEDISRNIKFLDSLDGLQDAICFCISDAHSVAQVEGVAFDLPCDREIDNEANAAASLWGQ